MARYALVVGIGDYDHPSLPNLSKPRADAEAMRDALQPDFEVTLLNEGVTRDRLRDALETLLLKRGKNSDVLIYFTGHGFTAGEDEDEAQGYLATQDCRVETDGNRVLSARKGFSFQSLNGLIARAELSSLVMLLDCCHGGSFIESAQAREKLSALNKTRYCLITACRSFEQAYAMTDAEHSIFSSAVLAALRVEEARVTALDVQRRVENELKNTGQEPLYVGAGSDVTILERWAVATPTVSEECPYQGLRAFTPETAQFFFGREDEIVELCQKLRTPNFVPVLGPSGSGKSSVVRAGLVTRLRTEGWLDVAMKPGKQPMVELERVLRQFFEDRGFSAGRVREVLVGLGFGCAQPPVVVDGRDLDSRVVSDDRALSVVVGEAFPQEIGQLDQADIRNRALSVVEGQLDQPNIKLLLIVDQFEEVFTLCEDKAAQQAFIRKLFYLGEVGASRIKVVMTMRSDFVDNWLAAGLSRSLIAEDTVWLGALQGEGLKAAIAQPAQQQGYTFESGLLKLLLTDVAQEENCLPLLEFALTGLWDRRETQARKLTVSAYEEMGGMTGALNRQATRVYDSLRPVDQERARRICLQLVRIGRKEKDTRQRQPKKLLLDMDGQDQQMRLVIADVIKDLVNGRLLVTDRDMEIVAEDEETDLELATEKAGYVDLAHEALLEGWVQFAQWRQEDRDLRRLVQRLEDDYEKWKVREESDDYLLKGGLLVELKEQREALSKLLREKGLPELTRFFSVSEEHDQKTVSALKEALAKVQIQEASRKIREKIQAAPTQMVSITLAAIELVGESQEKLSCVVYPCQDALHRTCNSVRERLKLEGHSDSACSVAFSPKGDRIVSGSDDMTLRLWDLQGNLVCRPFVGHGGSVRSVAFSPKGNHIISGSDDETVRLWDLQGNLIGQPFLGHSDRVCCVAFSPQGNMIISSSHDNTLRLWDLRGNPIGRPFVGHSSTVRSVAFSPQGDTIVSGGDDKTLRLWDLQGTPVGNAFTNHSDLVSAVAFSPQGDCIVSGSHSFNDGTLRLWDLKGNLIGEPFGNCGNPISSVTFNSKGDCIATGSHSTTGSDGLKDKTLHLWDLQGNLLKAFCIEESGSVESLAFSPEGNSVVFSSDDSIVRLWTLEENSTSLPFVGHDFTVRSVAFSPEGNRIISGGNDMTLRLWDLQGDPIGESFTDYRGSVSSVAFSPSGNYIVSGSEEIGYKDLGRSDMTLQIWDLEGNAIGEPFTGHSDSVLSVAFQPKGNLIASGSADTTVQLWDFQGNSVGKPFSNYYHGGSVNSVAFRPQGDQLVCGLGLDDFGNGAGALRLWDLQGNPIGEHFLGHSDSVNSVAFSPKGDRIVSGSSDRTLRLWNLQGNSIEEPFVGHSDSVNSVAFSPKGDRIVSGSSDRTLRLWDLQGNPIGEPFVGHSDSVNSVAFSPKGDLVVSGSDDATLRLWRFCSWEEELQYCCNLLMHHPALTSPESETARNACKVCEQVWTRQQSAEFAVAQGSALARRGEVDAAIAKFNRAQELDPALTFDAVARANELAAWG